MEAYLEMYSYVIIFRQLGVVPRSLGGRSKKSAEEAGIGTTESWKSQIGRRQFDHKSLEYWGTNLILRVVFNKNFLGL